VVLGSLRRRRSQKPSALEELVKLSSAAPALVSAGGLSPTGVGSVCLRAPEAVSSPAFEEQVAPLLAATTVDGAPRLEQTTDEFGHRWLTRRTSVYDLQGLVEELRAVNAAAIETGSGGALMCTLVGFTDARNPPVAMVFIPSRATWYPFAPIDPPKRDNARELAMRSALGDSLAVEPDLSKWFPVWGAPGL
jgi:hypothetical protein